MDLQSLKLSIDKAAHALMLKQKRDGSWAGEVELNPGPTAQAVMMHEALRIPFPENLRPKASRYILRMQNPDGGWSSFYGAPSDLSNTIECYLGLRLLGHSPDEPSLIAARNFILKNGGLPKANAWTQLYAAVLGVAPWEKIHKTPIEIMLLPKWSLIQLDDLSYWVKAITIPMALLGQLGPCKSIDLHRELAQELQADPDHWDEIKTESLIETYFPKLVGLMKLLPLNRTRAIERAWEYIDNLTEAHGDFGGNTCTAINVLLCLELSGHKESQAFKDGLKSFMSYAVEDDNEWRLQCCQSDVWDTGFAACALPDSATATRALDKTSKWFVDRQIRDVRGSWARNVSEAPGGWCFGNRHDHFPVTDCTALALLGLARGSTEKTERETIQRGIDWLCGMQHQGGGWSAYEKYQRGAWLNQVIKFKDLENALVDVPKADVSAKVIEALSEWRHFGGRIERTLKLAREFMLKSRTSDGIWRGNYGVNTIYGTAFAAKALRKLDGQANEEWAKPVRDFYLPKQNLDGGWGEVEATYRDHSLYGKGPSSPVQTAWTILMLNACDDASAPLRAALMQAAEYLIQSQQDDGNWHEPLFLGTVFPGMVYFRYELYSLYFPLSALQSVRDSLQE